MPKIAWIAFLYFLMPREAGPEYITSLISRSQYQTLFPHHHPIYSYENFIKACQRFPDFAGEKDKQSAKRELVAFFANIAHETGSGWPGSPGGVYAWGLAYEEEQACRDGHCTAYNTAGTSNYQPVPGKSYHGRGAMQITYAYNYGLAGEELGLPLLDNPDTVSRDGVIAFETALWFWMRPQKPKPSCHAVMSGEWQPDAKDSALNRRPGFGMTINIINGGLECNSTDSAMIDERLERIGFYKWFARIMKAPIEKDCDCVGMEAYGTRH